VVEIRRGGSGDAARDRLPWLEPVEDEDDVYASEGGYGGLILAAILVLVAIALLTAGILWYRGRQAGAAGNGQIIKAEPGPYKVRPPNPGGMTPDANGEVTYGTSAGQDVNSPIDLGALPEQPMRAPQERPAAPAQAQPQTAPGAPQPAAPPVAKPVPLPPVTAAPAPVPKPAPGPKAPAASVPPTAAPVSAGGGSGVIQLGAFSSEAKAKEAWKSLSARFAGLRDLGLAISPVESGDKTLYRLRATGAANGARLCAQLRVAGESCAPVN
jgi:cell division septation protein DedD